MGQERYVEGLVKKARLAQSQFEKFNQKQVDELVRGVAKAVYDNAAILAKMAIEETGMGLYEDKLSKNKGKAKTIWNDLKDKKSVGIIKTDEINGIVEIAKPIGVIASLAPTTNPIVTVMSNAMFALKGRNSIIIAPHPRAKKCSVHTVRLIEQYIDKYKAPQNLIQIIEEPSIEMSNMLMRMADVTVATGGSGMVKAAYSSGKPAFGVGPGNVQCIIDRDIDMKKAVNNIITGRAYDNGIICSGEQSAIIHKDDYGEIIEEFTKNRCYYIEDPKEKEAIRGALFKEGLMNIEAVGQSAYKIARMAGLSIPEDTRVILVEADGFGEKDLLCKEKMCPVLVVLRYNDFEEAVKIAQTNLEFEGTGHSVVIHSENDDHIEYVGRTLKVSRLVVNQPCSTNAGGSLYNGFAPTTTLGCGSWGNNSISENFTYKHMINITRIGYFMENRIVPTDEKIWG